MKSKRLISVVIYSNCCDLKTMRAYDLAKRKHLVFAFGKCRKMSNIYVKISPSVFTNRLIQPHCFHKPFDTTTPHLTTYLFNNYKLPTKSHKIRQRKNPTRQYCALYENFDRDCFRFLQNKSN